MPTHCRKPTFGPPTRGVSWRCGGYLVIAALLLLIKAIQLGTG
jgi:hypothetical protein